MLQQMTIFKFLHLNLLVVGDYTIEFQVRLDATSLVDTKTLLDREQVLLRLLRIYLNGTVRVNVNGSDIATSGGNALNNDVGIIL